ncbi:DUF4064 domain-containing protein [Listeria costaricensis]|uniref:DUF4064 domain-containing protein n=1 Tax=Listeria costaricensis TaxID=2026604 RepID=UPI0019691377|nr:DUF4064 domain-containing protein [Listeria costaricensis]
MNRQAEFILALIGAIFNTFAALLVFFYVAMIGIGVLVSTADSYSYFLPEDYIFMGIGLIFFVIIGLVIAAGTIFGYIAAFKIKADSPKVKTFGIVLIVFGGLQILSIQGILYLVAGILTLTHKPETPVDSSVQQETHFEHEGDESKWV